MPRSLRVFCHVFTAGWRKPIEDLIDAFHTADLTSTPIRFGIVGPEVGRAAVLDFLTEARISPVVDVARDEGNEAVTLNAVGRHARLHPDGAVLYCHLKGASRPMELNTRWRRAMIESVILCWKEILPHLEEFDVAGPFWIEAAEQEARGLRRPQTSGFFGGNFWIARNDHLARLPECVAYPRTRTEEWVAQCGPRVLDVLPGYPDHAFFGLEPVQMIH